MSERVNREAHRAAMRAVIRLEDDKVDPTLAQRVDAALAAALPHLTAEDVPHVAAQALRDAVSFLNDAAVGDYAESERAEMPALRTLHRHYGIALTEAATALSIRADRFGSADDLPA